MMIENVPTYMIEEWDKNLTEIA